MDLTQHMNTFGQHLRRRFGEPVHKVTVSGGFTCPNRDGTKGHGGCTFCNNRSFSPTDRSGLDIPGQIRAGQQAVRRRHRARQFMAYFQSYTNTYGELIRLQALYDEALAQPGIVGLSIGTRPDCVPDGVLDLLADYQARGFEIWLELGLQSANDDSLARVNRGHGFAEYAEAVTRVRQRGIKVCTHLIVGLPGEAPEDSLISLERVLETGTDGLKIHPLHVVKNTVLAKQWKRGEYTPLTQADYVEVVVKMVRRLPPEVIVHRLTGTAAPDILLAPEWCAHKWPVLNAICTELGADLEAVSSTLESDG